MTDTKKDCNDDVTMSFRNLISKENQSIMSNEEVYTKTSNDDFDSFQEFLAKETKQSNIEVPKAEAGKTDKSGSTKSTPKGNLEGSNHIENPSSSPSVGLPVQHDSAVVSTVSNTRVKCRKYGYAITLVGAVLIAAVALAVALKPPPPSPLLPPLSPYQPYVEVSRIIDLTSDGSEAEEDRYPYIASLKLQDGKHCCGGSLIAKDVILTAGHCLSCFDNPNPYVVLGRHNHNDNDGEEIDVREMMLHPNYEEFYIENIGPFQFKGLDNDFLLVFLEDPSTATNVRTVKLNSIASVPDEGQDVLAMGWGDTDPGDDLNPFTDDDVKFSDALMDITLQVVSSEECENSGGRTENMLCAKDEGQDACQGDSGGPLVVNYNDEDVQVGVISFGVGCAMDQYAGVYARVSQAYEWIQEEVCNGSTYASDAGFNCDKDEPPPITEACAFCPYGLTADGGWTPNPEIGNVYTCQDFMDYGTTIQAGSVMCEETLKSWEPLCCPRPPSNPCIICPNGDSVDENYAPYSMTYESQLTCGEVMSLASLTEAESNYCIDAYVLFAPYCCQMIEAPVPTPLPTNMELLEFSMPEFSMPTASPSETPTFDVSTSPSTAADDNDDPSYCFICQEGSDYGGDDYCITHPLYCNALVVTGVGDDLIMTTCREIVELYSRAFYDIDLSPKECGLVGYYEKFCCPTLATVPQDPCTICPNGVTASEGDDFAPYAVADAVNNFYMVALPNSSTCGELIDAAQQYESGSELCAQSEVHELYCCPITTPYNYCNICPNGATVAMGNDHVPNAGTEFVSGSNLSCGKLIEIAMQFESESSYCAFYGAIDEGDCCP